MNKTKIDWCDSTWNPVTGCLHRCEYCYARSIANRFGFHASEPDINERVMLEIPVSAGKKVPYPFDFQPTFHKYRINEYLSKKGRNIFVCSMADLFGDWVPEGWIEEVFKACEKSPQHNYLFLTKNPQRYVSLADDGILPVKGNMWFGTTVTNPMIPFFKADSTYKTFLSIEPILENFGKESDMIFDEGIDWIIIGAETGKRKNKVVPEREWIENIVNMCKEKQIPVFMKSSLADVWGELLIQEFPQELIVKEK